MGLFQLFHLKKTNPTLNRVKFDLKLREEPNDFEKIDPSKLGWVPDKEDPRDKPFSLDVNLKVESPTDKIIDNTTQFKHVSNQLNLPSCAANSGADFVEAALAKRHGISPHDFPDLSRMFVWWNARHMMSPSESGNPESGTYNRFVFDVAVRFGVPEEKIWPYDNKVVDGLWERATRRPSLLAYSNARLHTLRSFHSIQAHGQKRLSLVIEALHNFPGVVAGFRLPGNFTRYKEGVIQKPSPKDFAGNHSMIIVGYDPDLEAFKVRNHWGTGWGMDGYCWIHQDFVADPTKCGSLWVGK